jgi:hypothetical protein
MTSVIGTQTSNAWMIRIGWVLTGLTSANIILEALGSSFRRRSSSRKSIDLGSRRSRRFP